MSDQGIAVFVGFGPDYITIYLSGSRRERTDLSERFRAALSVRETTDG